MAYSQIGLSDLRCVACDIVLPVRMSSMSLFPACEIGWSVLIDCASCRLLDLVHPRASRGLGTIWLELFELPFNAVYIPLTYCEGNQDTKPSIL